VGTAQSLRSTAEAEDFEQELIDQYALAMAGAGVTDHHVAAHRTAMFEFIRFFGRPVWLAEPADGDRYLLWLRRDRRLASSTIQGRAWVVGRFFEFVIGRYQGDILALFDRVVIQPIDEFNKPSVTASSARVRVPPRVDEVQTLFDGWREALPDARKFLPVARDYVTASLWRRLGLRINETVMLDIRDWHPELGEHGKVHVRFGKGSRGRGPKARLIPAIDDADRLIEWWLTDVRHQFGDDWEDPDAPMFPSERHDPLTGHCTRAGREALRAGLNDAVDLWLPGWSGRLSPHGLRHFCASSLYERGMDLKAVQELLGHEWLSTTTLYVHVHDGHIERSWATANDRLAARFRQTTETQR
jgi:site-specific recombinase XerD